MAVHFETPSLVIAGSIRMCRFEWYKTKRQLFYRLIVIMPFLIALLLVILQQIIRFTDPPPAGLPSSPYPTEPRNLGYQGSFAVANQVVIAGYGMIFSFLIVTAAALNVANEYRWNTIKLAAINEPSRWGIALAKCLITAALTVLVAFSTILGWLLYGFSTKLLYAAPLELTIVDWENLGKGLNYLLITNLQTFIFALFAIALSFAFKSVVAGLIGYLAYVGLDNLLSVTGASLANAGSTKSGEGLTLVFELMKIINPFLITSSSNRLTMLESYGLPKSTTGQFINNPLIIAATPLWWAWLMLLIYCLIFTVLTVYLFARRDITD